MTVFGLLLGTVGLDPVRSSARFTFGTLTLQSGIDLVPMVMGLFGISEVFRLIESKSRGAARPQSRPRCPKDCAPCCRPARTGATHGARSARARWSGSSSACCPAAARRFRHTSPTPSPSAGPRRRRNSAHGAIAGVAAPESAANAATCSGFIPLLTLGLPDNVVMALILGAFMLHGVTPGPTLMLQHPEMFWAIVTSMFIGNCILILTMLPMIGLLSKITLIPNNILVPVIVLACLAGAYGVNNNPDRHRHHDGVRRDRLPDGQVRLSCGPAGARLRARADHGNGAAAIAHHVERQLRAFSGSRRSPPR